MNDTEIMQRLYRYILGGFAALLLCSEVMAQTADDLRLSYTRNGITVYENFIVCNDGQPPFRVLLKNETTHTGFTSFRISLGDAQGTVADMANQGSSKSFEYQLTGTYTVKLIGVTAGGREYSKDYVLKIVGKPNVTLSKQDEQVKCLGTEVKYIMEATSLGSDGTKYFLNYDDGSPLDPLTTAELHDGKGTFVHKYEQSYCSMIDHPERFFKVTLTYQNECYDGELTSVSEFVAEPFHAQYTFDRLGQGKVCTYEKVSLRNLTTGGTASDCSSGGAIPFWDFGNGVTSEDWEPYFEYTTAKPHHIKLVVRNDYACAADSVTYPVELYNRTRAIIKIDKDKVCAGETLKFYNNSTGDEITTRWSVIPLDGNPVPVYQADAVHPEITFDHWGKYKVVLYVTNVCSADETDTTITVRQNPDLVRYELPESICMSEQLDMERYVTVAWNGNEPKATWTLTRTGGAPNTGFDCIEGDLTTAFPVLGFTTPGTYTVTVNLPDVGCPGTKLTDTKQIVVHDPGIQVAIDTTPLNICEKGVVNFTNHSVGEDLRYEWAVRPASNVSYTGGTGPDAASPVLQFNKYGDYEVKLRMSTASGCGSVDTVYRVHVRKDPSIFFFLPPEAVCPGAEFALPFEGLVEYRFYNNEEKVKWTINPDNGGFEFKEGTGVNTPKPVIQFNTPGPYQFTVELESAGCPEPGIEQTLTRPIRVRTGTMSMNSAEAADTVVCENDNLLFRIEAQDHDGDPLTYAWSVSPTDGSFEFLDYGNDKKVAKVLFHQWGDYEVRIEASGFCGSLDTTFRVKVEKDPKVGLRDTSGLCPGEADMHDYVTYRWFNNVPEVNWKVTRVGLNPTAGFHIDDPHAEYPKIDFQEAGEYKVQVEAVSHTLGCDADSLQDVKTFRIYNPEIIGNIAMIGSGVAGDPSDICEGEAVTFTNTTNAEGGIGWTWTVEGPEGGYAFADGAASSTEQMPVITFTRYGDYVVRVVVRGSCDRKEYSFPVKVRGVPDIDWTARLANVCEGMTIDMQDYVGYPEAAAGNRNQTDVLTYTWSVNTDAGISVSPVIGSANTDFTTITFPEAARYVVTLELGMKCVDQGKMVLRSDIDILRRHLKAAFSVGKDTVGCTDDPAPFLVPLVNMSEGDSSRYTWTVTAETASGGGYAYEVGGAGEESPTLRLSEAGYYTIRLKAVNICDEDEASFRVKAFARPEVSVHDIASVCEPYTFEGKEQVMVIGNNDEVRRAQWQIVPDAVEENGGVAYLPGSTETSLFPEIEFKYGRYEVKAEYYNRCATPAVVQFEVKPDKYIPIEPLADEEICVLSGPRLLQQAFPEGGSWSIGDRTVVPQPAQVLYSDGEGKYYFNPQFDPYVRQEVELIYRKDNGSCIARDTMTMQVWPLPFVEAGDPLQMCLNHDPRLLTGLDSAAGAVWEKNRGYWSSAENAVLENHLFPATHEGDFKLYYAYTDGHACTNRDSVVMTVHGLPATGFTVAERSCIRREVTFTPIDPENNKFEWSFGDGTPDEPSEAEIVHRYAVYGYQQVVCRAENQYHCKDTSEARQIEIVNMPPPAHFSVDGAEGCPPFETEISVDRAVYADDHNYLAFHWDYGEGTETDTLGPIVPMTYPVGTWDTTYVTRFTVSNMCDTVSYETPIRVFSVPKVSFALMHEWECDPVWLTLQNTTTGNSCVFDWSFTNTRTGEVVQRTNIRNPEYEFRTDSASTTYHIRLAAHNNCGDDAYLDSLVVKPRSISAHFTPLAHAYACVNEELYFRNNSTDTVASILNTFWNFGDGGQDTLWSPRYRYEREGTYQVTLKIDNGCGWDTVSSPVTIYPLPHLEIRSEDYLCEADSFTFVLHSDQKLSHIEWQLGDGQKAYKDSLRYRYEGYGTFPVRVTGVSAEINQCSDSVRKEVTVYNKPILTILPMDTAQCSPLLYQPRVEGEAFLMWDYGDGSELSSAPEHRYENLSDTVGRFKVITYAETDKGCKSEYERWVTLYNNPRAALDKEVVQGNPQRVTFLNLSEEYTDCIWELPDGRVVHAADDQEMSFTEQGDYAVRLIAVNYLECRDTAELEHYVLIKGLYFPNTFIPHSQNGKVNRFNGIGMGLQEYKLEIFDQYGNKIWETRALERGRPSEGWDGCNTKGERMPQGMYIWRAKAIFADSEVWSGKNNESGTPQTTQGTVLLLRE